MRWVDEITLIGTAPPDEAANANGFANAGTEIKRTIFANKKSVGYSEFYKAQQAGYKTDLKFDVYAEEYRGEPLAEYGGKRFKILRTYNGGNGDVIELTLSDLSERTAEGGGTGGKN